MAWPKYYEDNIKIYDDRMYMNSSSPSTTTPSYKFRCPHCSCGCSTSYEMVEHIVKNHSKQYTYVVVNGEIITGEFNVKCIKEIKAINYDTENVNVTVIINDDTLILQSILDEQNNILDITRLIAGKIVKNINLILETKHGKQEYYITQNLDIHDVSIQSLNNGLYKSKYFFDEVSNGKYKIPEYRILLSLLAIENDLDTAENIIEKVNSEVAYNGFDANIISDFYLYYSLMTGNANFPFVQSILPSKKNFSAYKMLHALLKYDFDSAEIERTSIGKCSSIFEIKVCLLLSYIKGNMTDVRYFKEQLSNFPKSNPKFEILQDIIDSLNLIVLGNYEDFILKIKDIMPQFKNFYKYPLIKDIINIYSAVNDGVELMNDTYNRFNEISPLICAIKIIQTNDVELRKKYLKSSIKRFSDIEWFFLFCNDYLDGQLNINRITKKLPNIYWSYVKDKNASLKHPLSSQLLLDAQNQSDIKILPLGNSIRAGCSCFVVSCHGFNILLDAGIYPDKKGEDAYPKFELFSGQIDAIVISHAHLDHAGAINRAHHIWHDAPIITSKSTKAQLEPFLHDVAEQGKIDDEPDMQFSDANFAIETYNAISTIDFNKWITITNGVKIKLHPAGHMLGAAIVEINIGTSTIIYTGDFSLHGQELTAGARFLDIAKNSDVLICESTYYHTDRDVNWQEQRNKICDSIIEFHKKGKTILLPSNALGRSQELLCIISDLIENGDIESDIPIYIGGFAAKLCVSIRSVLNEQHNNILEKSIILTDDIIPDVNSIIICSSSSMKKNTTSYKIAEKIRKRDDNELVILMSGFLDDDYARKKFTFSNNYPLSVHSSRDETDYFIDTLKPKSIVFVHSGTDEQPAYQKMITNILTKNNGSILPITLSDNTSTDIWDIKNWIDMENNYEQKRI